MNDPISAVPSLHDREFLKASIKALAAIDADVQRILPVIGFPEPRVHAEGFATLMRIIVGQQVSVQSAAAIWQRLANTLEGRVEPQSFLDLGNEGWKQAGLSRPKMRYGEALARSMIEQGLDPSSWRSMDDDAVVEAITGLLGFGRWSADIYLLFALARDDVIPADDLAIQVGYQRLKGLESRPSAKELRMLTAPWSPYRGAGTLFLWHYYGSTTLDASA